MDECSEAFHDLGYAKSAARRLIFENISHFSMPDTRLCNTQAIYGCQYSLDSGGKNSISKSSSSRRLDGRRTRHLDKCQSQFYSGGVGIARAQNCIRDPLDQSPLLGETTRESVFQKGFHKMPEVVILFLSSK